MAPSEEAYEVSPEAFVKTVLRYTVHSPDPAIQSGYI